VKTGNPTACVTVNCKLCKSAIALYCCQYELIVLGVNKSSYQSDPRLLSLEHVTIF
jgi:hypothetical protein